MYLSDDRSELVFDQHLPGVMKDDVKVEVLEKSICLEFKSPSRVTVSRCYGLPYAVDPGTAKGEFQDFDLRVRVRLKEMLGEGRSLEL
jgi:HSP20 family molecular chaperone IbpA